LTIIESKFLFGPKMELARVRLQAAEKGNEAVVELLLEN
jgi:hypothetical protein